MGNIKIAALGVGNNGVTAINEMKERDIEAVELSIVCDEENIFASCQLPIKIYNYDCYDYEKLFDDKFHNTNIIFIIGNVFNEKDKNFILNIAKAAKLAETMTFIIPLAIDIEDEVLKKLKDVSDAVILSERKAYKNIEAIVSLLTQNSCSLSDINDVFHNIGTVFIGVSFTEFTQYNYHEFDFIDNAINNAIPKIYDEGGFNYLINLSTDTKTSQEEINKILYRVNDMFQSIAHSDKQTLIYGNTFDKNLDGVCRITVIIGMNDSGYRDFEELIEYKYLEGHISNIADYIENGLNETQIVKLGSYSKFFETALRGGYSELIELFITNGANPKIFETNGYFNEDILCDIMSNSSIFAASEIIDMLLEANINISPNLVKPLTRLNSDIDTIHIVQEFIDHGWNINACNEDGYTFLMYAVIHSSFECIKFLVEAGANVNAKNNYGNTPLSLLKNVSRRKSEEKIKILNFLVENGAKDENTSSI